MIDHEQAREWVSARADGELSAELAPALSEHLAACTDCARFGMRLPVLSEFASALPVDVAPTGFEARAGARLRARRPVRRWHLVPALAAAVAVAMFIVMVQPGARFELPRAAASDRLISLTSFYVERVIETRDAAGVLVETVREKTWWRAPDLTRHERTLTWEAGTLKTVEIHRGTEIYRRDGDETATIERDVAPSSRPLPEPLSPSILLVGRRTGTGPVIAGRPTDRYELTIDGESRIAYVDRDQLVALGAREAVVLGKGSQGPTGSIRKRVVALGYNPPIPDARFDFPRGAQIASDRAFERRTLDQLRVSPSAVPDGFVLVSAGHDVQRNVDEMLFARGAFRIDIEVSSTAPAPYFGPRPAPETRRDVQVGSRPADLVITLYEGISVGFRVDDGYVVVTAPLPPDALVRLAAQMFPE